MQIVDFFNSKGAPQKATYGHSLNFVYISNVAHIVVYGGIIEADQQQFQDTTAKMPYIEFCKDVYLYNCGMQNLEQC